MQILAPLYVNKCMLADGYKKVEIKRQLMRDLERRLKLTSTFAKFKTCDIRCSK